MLEINNLHAEIEADPTHNPLDRLKVKIDASLARITTWDLADALASGERPIIVRDHEVELGFFYLDPCNLHEDEEFVVGRRLIEELDRAAASPAPIATSYAARRLRAEAKILSWPD